MTSSVVGLAGGHRGAARRRSPKQVSLLRAVGRRLDQDPSIGVTLQVLVEPDAAVEMDSGADVDRAVAAARELNQQRLNRRRDQFRSNSLTTSQVQELLGGVRRQAVALRVANGGLLSLELGGRSYFPDWQFTDDGVVPGLRDLLSALRAGGRGVLAADAVMRTAVPEEGGHTPAQLLAAGDAERAHHYASLAGGG